MTVIKFPQQIEPKGNGARESLVKYFESSSLLKNSRANNCEIVTDGLLLWLAADGYIVVPFEPE